MISSAISLGWGSLHELARGIAMSPCRTICPFCFRLVTFEIQRTENKIDLSYDRQGRGNHIPYFENEVNGAVIEKNAPQNLAKSAQNVSFWAKC